MRYISATHIKHRYTQVQRFVLRINCTISLTHNHETTLPARGLKDAKLRLAAFQEERAVGEPSRVDLQCGANQMRDGRMHVAFHVRVRPGL